MVNPLMHRGRNRRRRDFIERYEFPLALRSKVGEKLERGQAGATLEGLREWYLACLDAPEEMLGMPSRAVDIAWHEMILMTRTYHHFCERAFGRYLHHSPEAIMEEPLRQSLGRTLAVVEGRSRTLAAVPLLFAIDSELDVADGHAWTVADIDQLRSEHQRYADDGGSHAFYGGGAHGGDRGGDGGSGCGGRGCGGGGCGGSG
jgi:hypothetical protein